ncbi:hypothetical protein [Paenibacillus xylaniclasticus]|uniref:hypothetical protein n=1 Tax=Paenibacillus xylaniclasticus TaxID=588083 RepID=UPI000FDCC9DE|nr:MULTISPECIES: hypothetical protein [Paenibacillus]GFN32079.1 hypothetical protein PCURB6_23390 [Paenibacillus curdlanolyticus]
METYRIQLVLASADSGYVRRISEYVRDTPLAERWQITAFTNGAALRHYLQGGFPVDMVAADAIMREALAAADELPDVPIAALCDGPGESQSLDVKEVKRLQPLPELFHALYAVYAEHSGRRLVHNAPMGAAVAAVYSAAGGAGKTTLAIHLAYQSAAAGSRTFYLNLEKWNASDIWLGGGGQGSFADDGFAQLIYTLQSAPDQAVSRLPGLCRTDSVMLFDYFEPCRNVEDRISLQPQTALQVVDAIAGSGLYDVVVIDMDSGISDLHMTLFQRSSRLFYVDDGTLTCARKTERYLIYGRDKWGEPFRQAEMKQIIVRRASLESGMSHSALSGLGHGQALQVPYIDSWRKREGGRLLPSSRYRSAADRLLEAAGIVSAKERLLC